MRSLEDYLPEDLSEDEHPSTDTSEDSVEVSVTAISRPDHSQLSRLPRKFRKAFEKDVPIASPVDFSVTSLIGSSNLPLAGVSSESLKPVPCHRSKTNKRKLSEPRRVVDHEPKGLSTSVKRSHEEEWASRKAHKGDGPHSVLRSPQNEEIHPPPNIIGPNPFIGHFVPPHLLLPHSWAHVGRYPYTHLVGTVLGPSLGLLPAPPYPLLPIIPPRAQLLVSPNPKTECATVEDNHLSINRASPVPPLRIPPTISSAVDKITDIPYNKKSLSKLNNNKKFLSVESLLNPTDRKPDVSALEVPFVPLTPMGSSDTVPLQETSDRLPPPSPSPTTSDVNIQSLLQRQPKQKQRNYKNMTRERRIEANARERTRVHTISAAFETLRRAVPSFSHNQKLSKLSVLRIASSYILSLSRLAGHDYSENKSRPSFEECVDLTTKTIQVEGKAKKKRDD